MPVTIKGKEYTGILEHGAVYIRCSYCHPDGAVFYCILPTPAECRRAGDIRIRESYLPVDSQYYLSR